MKNEKISLNYKLTVWETMSTVKAVLPRSHHKMHYPLLLKWTLFYKIKCEFITCSLGKKEIFSAKARVELFTDSITKTSGVTWGCWASTASRTSFKTSNALPAFWIMLQKTVAIYKQIKMKIQTAIFRTSPSKKTIEVSKDHVNHK